MMRTNCVSRAAPWSACRGQTDLRLISWQPITADLNQAFTVQYCIWKCKRSGLPVQLVQVFPTVGPVCGAAPVPGNRKDLHKTPSLLMSWGDVIKPDLNFSPKVDQTWRYTLSPDVLTFGNPEGLFWCLRPEPRQKPSGGTGSKTVLGF